MEHAKRPSRNAIQHPCNSVVPVTSYLASVRNRHYHTHMVGGTMSNPALITAIAGLVAAVAGLVTAIKAHARATTARDDAKEAGTLATSAQQSIDAHKDVHIVGGTNA